MIISSFREHVLLPSCIVLLRSRPEGTQTEPGQCSALHTTVPKRIQYTYAHHSQSVISETPLMLKPCNPPQVLPCSPVL